MADADKDWQAIVIMQVNGARIHTKLCENTSYEEAHHHIRYAMRDEVLQDQPHKDKLVRVSYMVVRASYMEAMRAAVEKDNATTH